jgi:hypothetical protein
MTPIVTLNCCILNLFLRRRVGPGTCSTTSRRPYYLVCAAFIKEGYVALQPYMRCSDVKPRATISIYGHFGQFIDTVNIEAQERANTKMPS